MHAKPILWAGSWSNYSWTHGPSDFQLKDLWQYGKLRLSLSTKQEFPQVNGSQGFENVSLYNSVFAHLLYVAGCMCYAAMLMEIQAG